jgi:hypothetical protein
MIEQADETWLKEFAKKISTPWDFTAIHVNKNNLVGVKNDIVRYTLLTLNAREKKIEIFYVGPLLGNVW